MRHYVASGRIDARGGFAYMRGPEDTLVEYAGNYPAERFNHVHLYQEHPFCASYYRSFAGGRSCRWNRWDSSSRNSSSVGDRSNCWLACSINSGVHGPRCASQAIARRKASPLGRIGGVAVTVRRLPVADYCGGMIGSSTYGMLPGAKCSVFLPPKISDGRSFGCAWVKGPTPFIG